MEARIDTQQQRSIDTPKQGERSGHVARDGGLVSSRLYASHWRNFWAMNSGPLSERMCSGIPRHSITSDNVSITSELPILRSTRIARHSRVYSSSSVSNRSVRPSWAGCRPYSCTNASAEPQNPSF